MDDFRREALLKEYGEVCNNFRLLTDIRFKLLAFLPIAAAAATALKGDDGGGGHFALSLFGLVATIGLITYNARNNQLYNELVGRAAAIERSLGLPDGAFANRPHPWLTIRLLRGRWKVDHGTGIGTIYAASIALWLFGALAPALQITARVLRLSDPSPWVNITALALAVLITYAAFRLIKDQRKKREKELRLQAARAVARAQMVDLSQAAQDAELVDACKHLCGGDTGTIDLAAIEARARFLVTLAPEPPRTLLAARV